MLSTRGLEAQLSLKELDTARIREGNSTARATAQYLINRDNLARDAIQHVSVFWNDQTARFEAERRWLYHSVDDGYIDPLRRRHGSAATLDEAIMRHGGEAEGSRIKFAKLRPLEQKVFEE